MWWAAGLIPFIFVQFLMHCSPRPRISPLEGRISPATGRVSPLTGRADDTLYKDPGRAGLFLFSPRFVASSSSSRRPSNRPSTSSSVAFSTRSAPEPRQLLRGTARDAFSNEYRAAVDELNVIQAAREEIAMQMQCHKSRKPRLPGMALREDSAIPSTSILRRSRPKLHLDDAPRQPRPLPPPREKGYRSLPPLPALSRAAMLVVCEDVADNESLSPGSLSPQSSRVIPIATARAAPARRSAEMERGRRITSMHRPRAEEAPAVQRSAAKMPAFVQKENRRSQRREPALVKKKAAPRAPMPWMQTPDLSRCGEARWQIYS